MSDTYTKLFSSITESTVWGESYSTRIVWVTMLAMADASGNVYGAVPGLARRANVTLAEVEGALLAFMSPDPYSRTKDEDGRRIEEIDGGWCLINHGKYSAVRGAEERREYKRQWDRDNRPSGHERTVRQQSGKSDKSPPNNDSPAPPTPTPTPDKSKSKELAQPSASRFDEFWSAYPVKKGRAAAERAWKAKRLDTTADQIIAHVHLMRAADDDWLRGYVPHGSTYITGDRWQDEPKQARAPPAQQQPQSKTLTGMKSLQGMKNGLVHERDHRRTDQADVLELGSDACLRLGADNGGDVD